MERWQENWAQKLNKMVRKIILALLFLMTIRTAYCQVSMDSICFDRNKSEILLDTASLIYKAKLLTLINYGLPHQDSILKILTNQASSLYKSGTNNSIILVKILNQQKIVTKYKYGWGEKFIGLGCSYLILYSNINGRFYRLDGFSQNDFCEFYKDLESKICFFDLIDEPNFEIIKCYYQKYIRKGKYKKLKCSTCCTDLDNLKVY